MLFRYSATSIVPNILPSQDDVVMGTLTVRENLYFSAALRLPNSMSWPEKKERVEKTISELGLDDCADTKVQYMYIE